MSIQKFFNVDVPMTQKHYSGRIWGSYGMQIENEHGYQNAVIWAFMLSHRLSKRREWKTSEYQYLLRK